MEPRKIQLVGRSTLSVSLPSNWVKSRGLKRGDLVYFNQDASGTLTLIAEAEFKREQSAEIAEISADLCSNAHMLSKILEGNYVLGRETINVLSTSRLKSEYVEAIRVTIRKLMGIAIIEETPNKVVLQSTIDITKFPLNTLIRRFFIIASTMYIEAMNALIEAEPSLAKDTIGRREEADTMFWIVVRLLDSAQQHKLIAEQIKIENPIQILWYRVVAQCLWLLAHWSDKIAQKVLTLETTREMIGEHLLKEIRKISENVNNIIHNAINSLFTSDIDVANKAVENYAKVQQEEEQLQDKICTYAYLRAKSFSVRKYFKGQQSLDLCIIAQLSFILFGMRRVAELGSEIAEIAITKAVSQTTKLCKTN